MPTPEIVDIYRLFVLGFEIMNMEQTLKDQIENFLYSDKPSATATKVVLAIIFVAGVLTIAAVAPNIFQIFGRKYRQVGRLEKRQFQKSLSYLKQKGFVEIVKESDDKVVMKITDKGRQKIIEYSIEELTIKKPKKWDKKWRVVIFDIPNHYKTAREALRDKLKELGFCKLQKSVWVYPYPCFEEIFFVTKFFNIGNFLELLTVEEMINDNNLLRHFQLRN